MTAAREPDAWIYFQKCAKALEDLDALFHAVSRHAAEEDPRPLPEHLEREFSRLVRRMCCNFDLMKANLTSAARNARQQRTEAANG